MTSNAPVQFYFDFISPFGYFASLRIDELAARHGRTVDWNPMLLGVSVLKVMNIPPIVSLPLKGPYIVRDAQRYARQHGVPFHRSASMPVSRPIAAGRAFAWARRVDPARGRILASLLLRSYFVLNEDIGDADVVEHCVRAAGLPMETFREAMHTGLAADQLRADVECSLANGVFGSPFFIADGEPFFGVEKLSVLEDWLRTGGW